MSNTQTSKKDKVAQFDAVAAKADKYAIAVHDLMNGKFSAQVRINLKDYDPSWVGGFYAMMAKYATRDRVA